MQSRRAFLQQAGLAAAAAALGAPSWARAGEPAGPAERSTLSIDGASGLWLDFLEEGDPAFARELANARASGLSSVLLTVGPSGRFWLTDAARQVTLSKIEKWQKLIDAHPEHLLLVREGADLARARSERRLGMIFGFQGTEPLGEDLERIAQFRALGLRVVQLTHNRRNLVGDGSLEPGNAGLSRFGHEVVERLNAERIVVDLAHGASRTVSEGIRASRAPMLISHTGCRALANLPRNTTDENLRALADRGGVAGIIFWPYLRTDTQPMAIDVVRHIEHAVKVCGEDHVGIGTDMAISPVERTEQFERDNRETIRGMKQEGIFAKERPDDLYLFIPDLNVANRFEVLAGMLSARGHSDARIAKILGENFARVMREVWG